jgi:hypothetical protein
MGPAGGNENLGLPSPVSPVNMRSGLWVRRGHFCRDRSYIDSSRLLCANSGHLATCRERVDWTGRDRPAGHD